MNLFNISSNKFLERVALAPAFALLAATALVVVMSSNVSAAPNEQSYGRKIWVENNCSEQVDLAIRYKDVNGQWYTEGWWPFPANFSDWLEGADYGDYLLTNNSIIYFYAESNNHLWDGGYDKSLNGYSLPMRKQAMSVDSYGDYVLSLNCGSTPPVYIDPPVSYSACASTPGSFAMPQSDVWYGNGNGYYMSWYRKNGTYYTEDYDGSYPTSRVQAAIFTDEWDFGIGSNFKFCVDDAGIAYGLWSTGILN